MHNRLVAPRPATTPPFGVVVVRAPGSPHPPPDGCVLIEHLSDTGNNDRIERRADQALPLFRRSMVEKFGINAPAAGLVTSRNGGAYPAIWSFHWAFRI